MSLHFELVSPAKLLFSGDVTSVQIPGSEGDMTILEGHAPVLSTLKPGIVTVTKDTGSPDRIFVRGGFAEVNPKGLILLAETTIPMAELDQAALARQVKNAEEDLADAKTDAARDKAQMTLEQLKAMQAAT